MYTAGTFLQHFQGSSAASNKCISRWGCLNPPSLPHQWCSQDIKREESRGKQKCYEGGEQRVHIGPLNYLYTGMNWGQVGGGGGGQRLWWGREKCSHPPWQDLSPFFLRVSGFQKLRKRHPFSFSTLKWGFGHHKWPFHLFIHRLQILDSPWVHLSWSLKHSHIESELIVLALNIFYTKTIELKYSLKVVNVFSNIFCDYLLQVWSFVFLSFVQFCKY